MLEPANVPGLIEPVEERLLSQLAASDFVRDNGVIVEFGSFFGRSTAALVNGASWWWSRGDGQPAVLAYDSFACRDDGAFAGFVRAFAERHGVARLLASKAGRLSFHSIYRHFMAEAEDAGLLRTAVTELDAATYDGGPIALMHIDAPKYYEELRPILSRFFPFLAPGGAVVFQDYFYHWSATLVAACQLLAEAGVLRFARSAASAAVAVVLRPPTADELSQLDATMCAGRIDQLLERSLATAAGMALDRPEWFLPRLRLAKAQWLWTCGEYMAAEAAVVKMFEEVGGLREDLFNDLRDLMRYGFDLRRVYELDHEVG